MLNQSPQFSKFSKKLKKNEMLNQSAVQQEIKEKCDVEEESYAEKEVKGKPKDSNGSVKLTGVTNDIPMEVTGFPCTASEKTKEIGSEKTKEPVYSITKSDSEKLVDYTESSELEDETSENCQINVDHDFNTDCHNIKDSMIGGKLLPVDAQPSSDYEKQDEIPISKLVMLEGNSEEKIKIEELFSMMMRTDPIQLQMT